MTWYAWALVVLCAVNVFVVIARIDKPRQPLTRLDAVVILVFNSLFIWAIVELAVKS